MPGLRTELSVREFFREIHLERSNTSLFEIQNPGTGVWEEISVWKFREVDTNWWFVADAIDTQFPDKMLRVTIYSEFDNGLDEPYLSTVESWKVDTQQIEEWFNANEF